MVKVLCAAVAAALAASAAHAQLKVGLTLSLTGPAARWASLRKTRLT